MADNFDSDNLMYVTKHYETEIKEKAKKIFADNDIAISIENVNKQLNDIISEMDDKLTFVTNKISAQNGVDDFMENVHTSIDSVEVNHNSLVDPDIKNTKTHPSIIAFKENRGQTKYDTYDFINANIKFNEDPNVSIFNTNNDKEYRTHCFSFNASDKEYLKIIEFSLTYKQTPELLHIDDIKIRDDISIKDWVFDKTVCVTRIISGRFFIIRHDPVNHPKEFIVKAIIKNSDNTGSYVDRKILDVSEYLDNGNFTYTLDNGPQIEMYFTFDDNSSNRKFNIYIGKITPYRFAMEKTYIDVGSKPDDNFKLIETISGYNGSNNNEPTNSNIEEVFYSKILASSLIVDKTHNKIIYSKSDHMKDRITFAPSGVNPTNIETVWIKDVGNYCFIRVKAGNVNTTYIASNSFGNVQDLQFITNEVKELSTGEIVLLGKKNSEQNSSINYYYFDTSTNKVSNTTFADITDIAPAIVNNGVTSTFGYDARLVEIDDEKVIILVTGKDGLYYKIKEKSNLGTYAGTAGTSYKYKVNEESSQNAINTFNPDSGTILVDSDSSGIYVDYKIFNSSNNTEKDFIYHLNKLTKTGISYNFKVQTLLKSGIEANEVYNDGVKKIVCTSLLNFLISNSNQLYVIDENRILKAVSFTEVDTNLWSDMDSIIYMKPESNQEEYYLSDNAYLQNVINICETPNGIYIIDKKGVYYLEASKNLICKYYAENNAEVINYLESYDRFGKTGAVVTISDSTINIDTRFVIYKNDYTLKNISSKKLRYNYIDLYDKTKYQMYSDVGDNWMWDRELSEEENWARRNAYMENFEYDDTLPLIQFEATLYCSFVDHLSPIYNNTDSYRSNASYDPHSRIVYQHSSFEDSYAHKYILTPNKYGFVKFDNLLSLDPTSYNKVSDINEIKRIKIIHKRGDPKTYNDIKTAIDALISNAWTEDNDDNITIKNVKYVKRSSYTNENLDNVLTTLDLDNIVISGVERIKTRYGYYLMTHNDSTSSPQINLGYQSENLETSGVFNRIAISNLPQTARDFNVVDLGDPRDTVLLSDSQYVYRCHGRSADLSSFKIPFTTGTTNDRLMVSNKYLNRLRKFDNAVYLWRDDTSTTLQDLYTYSIIDGNIIKSDICSLTGILDVIKIGNNFHIFNIDGNKIHYHIYGDKTADLGYVDLVINETPNPNNTKVKIYDFNDTKIVYIENDGGSQLILKYDSELDEFVNSMSFKIDTNSWHNCIFGKLNGKIYCYTVNTSNQMPRLSIYHPDSDSLETIDSGYINNVFEFRTGTDGVKYKFRNYIDVYEDGNIFTTSKNQSNRMFNTPHDKKEYMKSLKISLYPPFSGDGKIHLVSKPYPIDRQIGNDHFNDYKNILIVNASSLDYEDEDDVDNRKMTGLYIVDSNSYFNDNNKIGGFLSNDYNREYVTLHCDEENFPIKAYTYFNGKQYYKLNGVKTKLYPLPKIPASFQPNGESTNFPYEIFKTSIIDTPQPQYDLIDKTATPVPIMGFVYYVQELNGSYTPYHNLKEFDPLKEYYIRRTKFEYIQVGGASVEIDPTARYYYAFHKDLYLEPTEDFDTSTGTTKLKSDINYYTLEHLTGNIEISLQNVSSDLQDLFSFNVFSIENLSEDFTNNIPNLRLTYRPTETSVMCSATNNKIFDHMNLGIIKFWNTKFGTFGIFDRPINDDVSERYSLVRCSDDLRCIYDILIENFEGVVEDIFNNVTYTPVEVYETSENVFISDSVNNKTYRFNPNTKIMDVVFETALKFITEFEDGSIYGKTNDNNLSFVKYIDDENDLPKFDRNHTISYNDIVGDSSGPKCVKRYNRNGNLELYIYGTQGSKYNIYKFSEHEITPAFTDLPVGYTVPQNILSVNNILFFTFSNNGKNYRLDPDDYTTQMHYNNRISNGVQFSDIDNYIGNYASEYKKETFVGSVQEIFSQIEVYFYDKSTSPWSSVHTNYDYSTNVGKLITNNDGFLPIIDKDGNIYFKDCCGNIDTLMPDYTRKYRTYDTDETTLISDSPKFDQLFLTSIGIFGFIGSETYLNRIYDNSENFIKIESEAQITGTSFINLIENKYGIFIAYGTQVGKFNSETNSIDVIHNGNSGAVSETLICGNWNYWENKNFLNNQKYHKKRNTVSFFMDKEEKELYFVYRSNNRTRIFRYRKNENDFTPYYDAAKITNICDISLGLFACGNNDGSVYNLTTQMNLSIANSGTIYGLFENPVSHEIYAYGSAIWKYDAKYNKWIVFRNFNLNESTQFIERIECYSNDKDDGIYWIFSLNHDYNSWGAINLTKEQMATPDFLFTYAQFEGIGGLRCSGDLVNRYCLSSIETLFVDKEKDFLYAFENDSNLQIIKKIPMNRQIDTGSTSNRTISKLPDAYEYKSLYLNNSIINLQNNMMSFGGSGPQWDHTQSILVYKDIIFATTPYLFTSAWRLKRQESGWQGSLGPSNKNHVLYQYEFTGINRNRWNNEINDVSLTMKDKYRMACVGTYSPTDGFDRTYYDYNNDFMPDVSDLKGFLKDIYLTNKSKRKGDIRYPKNKDLMNTFNAFKIDPLEDFSIFDNDDFEIDLTIYPTTNFNSDTVRVLRPYNNNSNDKTYEVRNTCLPYDPYVYE